MVQEAPTLTPPGCDNTSGQGSEAAVPAEIQGWSWGGFLLHWIWAAVHKAWLGFALSLFLGIVGMVLCGIKGNEWAWQNNRYESVEQFRKIQGKWSKWGVILWLASFALSLVIVILAVVIVVANR